MRRRILIPVLAFLSLVACSRKEVIPEEVPVPLTSVSVSVSEVRLKEGESMTVPFSVQSPECPFNYTLSSPDCQVFLLKPGGKAPSGYQITAITAEAVKGSYAITLTDMGTGEEYDDVVCLAIRERPGSDTYVRSAGFSVRFEKPAPKEPYLTTGLPVVYVNTENGQGVYSKEEFVPASVSIEGTDKLEGMDAVSCSIRGRGNTTWYWPKKPYLIKLDKKASVFGLPKHKRWVLLANFMDRTLMRNLVSMKVASFTSLAWSPHCVPVELVLNGKHQGNYLLIEQVRVDKNRVNVTEMTPEDNEGEALTGGYLLELDFHFDNEVQWKEHNIPFAVKYPDSEDLTAAQLSYIKQYIADASAALYGEDFQDPEIGYEAYLDVASFVDYWIVYEVMGNHELGNPGSVYFHKDRGGKLVAGPCWDFDWGILSYNTSPHAKTGLINRNAIWYARLFRDPAFVALVKERFQELLPQLRTIPAFMDQMEELLEASAALNFKMWNPAQDASVNNGNIINGDEKMSFNAAVARIRDIYEERLGIIEKSL